MNPKVSELLDRIRQLEDEIEQELRRRRAELHADFENRRIRFERDVLERHRRLKTGLPSYLLQAKLRHVLTAPLVYAVVFPLLLLDLCVTAYQHACFRAYGIARVRRGDYFVYDRDRLAYLNIIEKFNCTYCSYANGLSAYVKEIVGRTEQYWCPIKHARRILHAHPHYADFVDFGDAEAYRRELDILRRKLVGLDEPPGS